MSEETYAQRIARLAESNLADVTQDDLDALIQLGERAARADYWRDVQGIAEDCKRAIADGEIENEEGVSDWLHQTIDGCSRVIYTAEAERGLPHSDNETAFEDEFGETCGFVDVSVRMYWALRADVLAEMGDLAELFETDEDEDEDEEEGV